MAPRRRVFLKNYLSAQYRNPLQVAWRLLNSGDEIARAAIFHTLAGILLSPVDWGLRPYEQHCYRRAEEPRLPMILVVGPPRSGTTLLEQVLINAFDVGYLNNLTSLFPRSPIAANTLFGRFLTPHQLDYASFYGKSRHLSGPNDALYIWDRWLGNDRTAVPVAIEREKQKDMLRFWGAYESFCGKAIVNKVNRLDTCAHLVAEVLSTAHFICLHRNPVHLAQSLFIARKELVGDTNVSYGVKYPGQDELGVDTIEDVCRQVLYHEHQGEKQRQILGSKKFWLISYEQFCANPPALVARIAREILNDTRWNRSKNTEIKPFKVSDKPRLDPTTLVKIKHTLTELGAGRVIVDKL